MPLLAAQIGGRTMAEVRAAAVAEQSIKARIDSKGYLTADRLGRERCDSIGNRESFGLANVRLTYGAGDSPARHFGIRSRLPKTNRAITPRPVGVSRCVTEITGDKFPYLSIRG